MSCIDGHCVTCGDDGVPMHVRSLRPDHARCADEDGVVHEVAVELVEPVTVGDELLVHAGVAIRNLTRVPAT